MGKVALVVGLRDPLLLFLQCIFDQWIPKWLRCLCPKKESKKFFKRLEQELAQQRTPWPPLHQPILATPKTASVLR